MKGRHPHTCPADYKIISRQASFKPPSPLYSSQGIPQMWGVLKGHRGETYPHTESVCWASHPHSWEKGGFFFSTVTQHFQDFQDSIPKSILTVYFLEELCNSWEGMQKSSLETQFSSKCLEVFYSKTHWSLNTCVTNACPFLSQIVNWTTRLTVHSGHLHMDFP